ncbi:MAG: non-canonical purine NTP diphosphatase [Lentimicrobiaceae bacterium]|nr:non-canonical purine NTP diphosphatase [Lentimicrobiaceae bacterium]
MELIFASNNKHKLDEVKSALGREFNVVSLSEIGCFDEIPEDHDTLEENALQKARYICEKYGKDCFSDDTGLEIEALGGRPGVYSARYAGEHCSFEDNMQKVLSEMNGISNRKACFRTVIALILSGKEYLFEGKVDGKILTERHGENGFGYDPIFQPDGYNFSFAEMALEDKNNISHRGRAVGKLVGFLKNEQ